MLVAAIVMPSAVAHDVDFFFPAQGQRDPHHRLIRRADLAHAHAIDRGDAGTLVAAGVGQLGVVDVDVPALIGAGDASRRRRCR